MPIAFVLKSPSRAGGQSKPSRSGTLAPECIRDRCPQRSVACSTLGCARPKVASVRPLAPRRGRRGSIKDPKSLDSPLVPRDARAPPAAAATAPHAPAAHTDRPPPRAVAGPSAPPTGPARCRRRRSESSATRPGPGVPRTTDSAMSASREPDRDHAAARPSADTVASRVAPAPRPGGPATVPGENQSPAWHASAGDREEEPVPRRRDPLCQKRSSSKASRLRSMW